MNGNKEFIHLDDVFKGLKEGEESYKPGAWDKMKHVLEKEMPIGGNQPTGSSSKWPFLSVFGLFLIIGASVLTYSLTHHLFQQGGTPDDASLKSVAAASSENHSDTKSVALSGSDTDIATLRNQTDSHTKDRYANKPKVAMALSNTINRSTHQSRSIASSTKPNSAIHAPSGLSTVPSTSSVSAGGSNKNLIVSESKVIETSAKNNNTNAQALAHNVSNSLRHNNSIKLNTIEAGQLTLTPVITDKGMFSLLPLTPSVMAMQESLAPVTMENRLPGSPKNPNENPEIKPTVFAASGNKHITSDKRKQLQKQLKNHLFVDQNGGVYKESRDTFSRLEVIARTVNDTRNRNKTQEKIIMDTTASYKVARQTFTPLTISELKKLDIQIPAQTMPLVPASSLTMVSESDAPDKNLGTYVYLSNYLISTKSVNQKKSGMAQFFQTMGDELNKWFDGSRSWYLALIAGGNTGIDGNGNYGLQVGADLLYDFAERWTLSAGLRYKNGFLPDYKFGDNAVSYDVTGVPQQNGYLYSGTRVESQRTYDVNRLSQIQMPFAVKYCLGRVSVFGGPIFTYYLPTKYNQSVQTNSMEVSRLVPGNENPFSNTPYSINPVKVFDTRLGLGYQAGFQYDFSRKFSLEMRVNQILLDNFSGYSPKALQRIYHQPNLELNMSFYFGRREKVLYMMKHD